jgi:hypothetical protein
MNSTFETIAFNSIATMQSSVLNRVSNDYSHEEVQLAAQYGMTVEQMQETVEAAKLYPNVECDENGMPVGCTYEHWFDELDKRLIAHFGEEYRLFANKRREKSNKRGLWKFDIL